jgi:phosphotransferase system IIA component
MGGKGFTAHIQQGEHVKKGQLLVDVDLNAVNAAGYETQTPIVNQYQRLIRSLTNG